MKTFVSLSKYLIAASMLTACVARAQRPDQIALKPPAQSESVGTLQVLDDYGVPITEQDIKRYQGKGGARWFMQPIAFIAGAAALYAAVPKGSSEDNCSIYDPCSDREKFYRSSSAITGGILGVLIFNAAGPGLTRWQAIQKVREERRRTHRGN